MPISSVAGSSFTVTIETVAYTGQITRGSVQSTPNVIVTKTLGPNKATTQTDVEDTSQLDFLYDNGTGLYGALYTASRTGAALTLVIDGGYTWTGECTVTDLSAEFTAEDAASCSVSLVASAGLTYAA